jgi:hypothetical protein
MVSGSLANKPACEGIGPVFIGISIASKKNIERHLLNEQHRNIHELAYASVISLVANTTSARR